MKRTLLTGVLLFSITSMFAQTKDLGNPVGWSARHSKTNIPVKEMPSFDLSAMLEADEINNQTKDAPYRFGFEHIVEDNLANSGEWTVMPNGNRFWRLAYKSEGALTMNVSFSNFKLPEGAKLHVYNQEMNIKDGAYTSSNNNENNALGTFLIPGDVIIIELFEPKDVVGISALQVGMVVHGYKDINNWFTEKVNESGGCNMDVVCPDGAAWENEINSVARIINGGGLCTGTLVNNTANNGIPYFLTANHCGPQNMGSAVFQFNYKSPVCGSQASSDSQDPGTNDNVNGSIFRARRADSDFGLIELNSIPDPNYGVFYAGWDNSGNTPNEAIGIHHPAGDVMKISFDDDPLTSTTYSNNAVDVNGTHWRIETWERNTTTEGGSSGSAIFDGAHRLVGQLHGGGAACGNTQSDWYGRFSQSWDGNSSSERLRDWLDPSNNTTTLDGFDPDGGPSLALDAGIIGIASPTGTLCASTISPEVTLRNYGTTTLTSLTINYSVDGGAAQTFNWSGSLAQYGTEQVTLPTSATTNGNHTIVVTSSAPNGGTDENTNNDNASSSYSSIVGGIEINLALQLDCYGDEITWEIKDASNIVLYSGGPYSTSFNPPLIEESFCLEENQCYDFVISDTYGDGLAGGGFCQTTGSYDITNSQGVNLASIIATDGDFGSEEINNFCATVGITEHNLDEFIDVYPNPSSDMMTVETSLIDSYSIELMDQSGRVVYTNNLSGYNKTQINTQKYASGIYMIRLKAESGSSIQKVIFK